MSSRNPNSSETRFPPELKKINLHVEFLHEILIQNAFKYNLKSIFNPEIIQNAIIGADIHQNMDMGQEFSDEQLAEWEHVEKRLLNKKLKIKNKKKFIKCILAIVGVIGLGFKFSKNFKILFETNGFDKSYAPKTSKDSLKILFESNGFDKSYAPLLATDKDILEYFYMDFSKCIQAIEKKGMEEDEEEDEEEEEEEEEEESIRPQPYHWSMLENYPNRYNPLPLLQVSILKPYFEELTLGSIFEASKMFPVDWEESINSMFGKDLGVEWNKCITDKIENEFCTKYVGNMKWREENLYGSNGEIKMTRLKKWSMIVKDIICPPITSPEDLQRCYNSGMYFLNFTYYLYGFLSSEAKDVEQYKLFCEPKIPPFLKNGSAQCSPRKRSV